MRRPGIAETGIGIFILALLAGIAGGIYIAQSRFDPDFSNYSPEGRQPAARTRCRPPVRRPCRPSFPKTSFRSAPRRHSTPKPYRIKLTARPNSNFRAAS